MIKIHGNTNFKKFQFFSKKVLKIFLCSLWINFTVKSQEMTRAVTSRDNLGGGGGGEYSYTRVLPDVFLLKAIVFTVCEHDYMNIHPPPIIASSYGPGNDHSRLPKFIIFQGSTPGPP
jgi:hypothetical protein